MTSFSMVACVCDTLREATTARSRLRAPGPRKTSAPTPSKLNGRTKSRTPKRRYEQRVVGELPLLDIAPAIITFITLD